jgi:putative phosphoribosyl transferase
MSRQPPLWDDRRDAGRALAERLVRWRGRSDARVVGLPRGGVVVAAEVAKALDLPLVSWAVRKVAHPQAPELAIGAIAPGGVLLWDEPYLRQLQLDPLLRRHLVAEQDDELRRRQRLYGDPAPAALRGCHLLVVDDGIATGLTARAALQSLRLCRPASVVLAVPVLDGTVLPRLETLVDELEVLAVVDQLSAVGLWYRRFEQVADADVLALLTAARRGGNGDPASSGVGPHRRERSDLP